MDKVATSMEQAVSQVCDGATILCGGFGLCGIPENAIQALVDKNIKELTLVSNNCGVDDFGLGLLLAKGQVRKIVASYVGENRRFERLALAKRIEVELVPQGTLAERIRAGGAGIPAFYTPAGIGTPVEQGRERRRFGSRDYLMELAIRGDFALVKAWRGDRYGNLVYRRTARNFNPLCAAAAKVTIAEVETIEEVGAIDADSVHTPGIFVQHVVLGRHAKRIERRTVLPQPH